MLSGSVVGAAWCGDVLTGALCCGAAVVVAASSVGRNGTQGVQRLSARLECKMPNACWIVRTLDSIGQQLPAAAGSRAVAHSHAEPVGAHRHLHSTSFDSGRQPIQPTSEP
jgi:hypothetical protein